MEVQPREVELDQLGEEEEACRHGASLEQRGEHKAESVGENVLLDRRNAVWIHVHDGTQQGEHQLGYVEVVVAYQDRELVQHCLVESGGHCGEAALGTSARAYEDVVTVVLEDGVQTEQSAQPQVAMVLTQEAGQ